MRIKTYKKVHYKYIFIKMTNEITTNRGEVMVNLVVLLSIEDM